MEAQNEASFKQAIRCSVDLKYHKDIHSLAIAIKNRGNTLKQMICQNQYLTSIISYVFAGIADFIAV